MLNLPAFIWACSGDPDVRSLVDESDCVLGIGVALTDLGTGFWTLRIDPKARVMIDPDSVQIKYHHYDGLPMTRVVATLLKRLAAGLSVACTALGRSASGPVDTNCRAQGTFRCRRRPACPRA